MLILQLLVCTRITISLITIFAIGSITKVFTTILLADMVDRGLVNLDDPIEKYLPSTVKVPKFNGKNITLENLATHTSGLPEWPGSY
jgi:D-alanyl-D-alanine-carboxypeptidase/D-alanyl-D-alanine-endopeptidase